MPGRIAQGCSSSPTPRGDTAPLEKLRDALRLTAIAASDLLPHRLFVALRRSLYRAAGARVGEGVCLYGRQLVLYPQRLVLSDRCFVNVGCTFENAGGVEIGTGSYVGPGVSFLTTNHGRDFASVTRPIVVGKRVWIGGGAILLPGTIVADGTVIAAGAVVRGDIREPGLYAGVPAVRKSPRLGGAAPVEPT